MGKISQNYRLEGDWLQSKAGVAPMMNRCTSRAQENSYPDFINIPSQMEREGGLPEM